MSKAWRPKIICCLLFIAIAIGLYFNNSEKLIEKEVIKEKYQLEELSLINYYSLDFEGFKNKEKLKQLKYPIIVSRFDCKYCQNY